MYLPVLSPGCYNPYMSLETDPAPHPTPPENRHLSEIAADLQRILDDQREAEQQEALRARTEKTEAAPDTQPEHDDTPRREVLPAAEALRELNVGWQGLRGYNLAGLAGILEHGIEPSLNYSGQRGEERAVCLSVPFAAARGAIRESNSLYMYSLTDGISVGVDVGKELHAGEVYGGFEDETRLYNTVAPEQIVRVMVPERALDIPLNQLPVVHHEQRRPEANIRYMKAAEDFIEKHGGPEAREHFSATIQPYRELAASNTTLSREQNLELNQIVMDETRAVLAGDNEDLTLRQALELVLQDRPDVKLVTFSDEFKDDVGKWNSTVQSHENRDPLLDAEREELSPIYINLEELPAPEPHDPSLPRYPEPKQPRIDTRGHPGSQHLPRKTGRR
jgi:hypothetical protein